MSSGQTTVGRLAVELGLSDEQFRQALAHAQVMAQQAGQKMQQSINKAVNTPAATPGGRSNAMGLLNLSRAVDDVQYGFRGVINNIEGIVTGFGGSAGLAGAATIAGVAMMALVPKIAEVVMAADPIKDLSKNLRDIQNSGLNNTFAGFAKEARATQAAFEAASEALDKMQSQQMKISAFAGGPGMGAAPAASLIGDDPKEMFRQRLQFNELAQDAAKAAFRANQAKSRVAAGGLASFEQTDEQKEQVELNKKLFQEALNKMGGGQQLFDALKIKNLGNPQLFGAFKDGDIEATKQIVKLLGLQAEQKKILADDYERVTGSAKELARIEEQRIEKQKRIDEKQFSEYQAAVKSQDSLFSRRDSLMNSMQRSEIVGSADVFSRNLNAGMKNEELKQLEEINQGIKELKPITGLG
jgi:hypothetical protein